MNRSILAMSVSAILSATAFGGITIPTVPIGNPNNAADPLTGDLYGSVAYTYNIGSTEVTNAQYAAFLNAVAATDTNNLYNTNMAGWEFGGITRTGGPGTYTYATASDLADHPVNFVSFWDAVRFANWLHNGQPTGDQNNTTTEDGAYTLTPDGITANTITRNAGWQWAVTSEDEWYKAAYHQPADQGGDSDSYWLYPTSSNSAPSISQPPQVNTTETGVKNTEPVGRYAANYYGTFDMGGNVSEWNEAVIVSSYGSSRGLRGSSFTGFYQDLRADWRTSAGRPTLEYESVGFRVSQIPGPGSVALLAFGGIMSARRRR